MDQATLTKTKVDTLTYIRRAGNVESKQDFHQICQDLCSEFDFDYFYYTAVVPQDFLTSNTIVVTTVPEPWLRHSAERNYRTVDHNVEHTIKHITPVIWSEADADEGLTEQQRQIVTERLAHELYDAISFCVKNRGDAGHFNFVMGREDPVFPTRAMIAFPTLLAVAVYLHEAILAVHGISPRPRNLITPRERECVLHRANGLTDQEIAEKLGIGIRTVRQHLDNVAVKLGVGSRKQITAQVLSQGMVSTVDADFSGLDTPDT